MIFKKVVGGGTYPGDSSVFTGTTLWRWSDQLFLFISVGSVELLSDSCCCCC